jgi:hypothetical protein
VGRILNAKPEKNDKKMTWAFHFLNAHLFAHEKFFSIRLPPKYISKFSSRFL